jgi:hypothetical protein
MLNSPLAEKRLLLSLMKKKLVGRRAYSDSIHLKRELAISTSLPSSASSSQCSTPTSEAYSSSQEIEEKAFAGIGC